MEEIISHFFTGLYKFLFYYPLFMAYLWMIGALYYFKHWETGKGHRLEDKPQLPEYPPVSIIVPCYDEAENIEETMK